MRIFLGSSSERRSELTLSAQWVETAGHIALPWTLPGLFPVGEVTFYTLNALKDTVDGAVFILGADDASWYRGTISMSPRDNVLIEYGLFAGALSPERVAICQAGEIRLPIDLLGITLIDMKDSETAELNFYHWLNRISQIGSLGGTARFLSFENKFQIPNSEQFWSGLPATAMNELAILGQTNKSWLHRSPARRAALLESVVSPDHASGLRNFALAVA